jgi:uncharacterized RDD family membrane protein YckC
MMSEHNPYASPDADVQVDTTSPGELAGRGLRLGGSLIDGILIVLTLIPVLFLTGYWERAMAQQSTVTDIVVGGVLGVGIFLLLNGYLLMTSGQTVAKRILKMRIVSVHDERILPFGKLIGLRYLPQWVCGQLPLVGGIYVLINALFIFGEQRRCLHDHIAGSKVVMAKS